MTPEEEEIYSAIRASLAPWEAIAKLAVLVVAIVWLYFLHK